MEKLTYLGFSKPLPMAKWGTKVSVRSKESEALISRLETFLDMRKLNIFPIIYESSFTCAC